MVIIVTTTSFGMRSTLFVCLILALVSVISAQSSSSSSSSGNPSPLPGKLTQLALVPPLPGPFDFQLAHYSPVNVSWYINVGVEDILVVDWLHTNCSNAAVPVFTFNDEVWNEPCDDGYDALTTQSAFAQYYATRGLSVDAIVMMYYPHLSMSVSGNLTKIVLVDKVGSQLINKTLAIVPNCAYYFLIGQSVLTAAIDNGEDTSYTYFFSTIEPEYLNYLSAVVNPFAGAQCFFDGQVCWDLLCQQQQSESDTYPSNANWAFFENREAFKR